jgi:hypothetical protein
MLKQCCEFAAEREIALAHGLKEVAAELRLIDAADLVAYIRTGQFANVRSLVKSSTEMYFKPGTVSFGLSGMVDLNWDREPSIVLDMEFRHRKVNIFFKLLLENQLAGVEIDYISFDDAAHDPREDTRQLMDAIADARIPVISTAHRD